MPDRNRLARVVARIGFSPTAVPAFAVSPNTKLSGETALDLYKVEYSSNCGQRTQYPATFADRRNSYTATHNKPVAEHCGLLHIGRKHSATQTRSPDSGDRNNRILCRVLDSVSS